MCWPPADPDLVNLSDRQRDSDLALRDLPGPPEGDNQTAGSGA